MMNECNECPWRWADHDGEIPHCHCDIDVAPCEEIKPEEPDDTPKIVEENDDSTFSDIPVDQLVKLFSNNTHFVLNPNDYGMPSFEWDGLNVPISVRGQKVLLIYSISPDLIHLYT